MTGAEAPAATRPWWEPLLGVSSLGFGALQALSGLALAGIGLAGPASARGAFLLAGAAWIVPGVLLFAAGLLLLLRHRRAPAVALAAALSLAAGVGVVAARRIALPPAVADAGEWALRHPSCPPAAKRLFDDVSRRSGTDGLEALRDPGQQELQARVFTGYCCVPLPWHLLMALGAWAAGRRRKGD